MTEFYAIIKEKLLSAIAEGKKHLVFWGRNDALIRMITELHTSGLSSLIAGIVDEKEKEVPGFTIPIVHPRDIASLRMDTLVIMQDSAKEDALRKFAAVDRRTPKIIIAGDEHLKFNDPIFDSLLVSCPVKSKASGYPLMLTHIFQSLVYLAKNRKQGAIAEFGCFQCGTTVFIAKLMQRLSVETTIYAFDTFDGYPAAAHSLDLFSSSKCEFRDFDFIQRYCTSLPIKLVRGNIRETISSLAGIELMFSFFDTDNYSPTKAALEICCEQTVPGGILAFDHFFSEGWVETIGERIAAKEILQDKAFFNLHGTGIFIKI